LTEVDSVCHVSGWKDSDKEGSFYRDYFPSLSRYVITNFPDDNSKGMGAAAPNDYPLDLRDACPPELSRQFDLAFSHTVLEHVRCPEHAFGVICEIATSYVLTVVPFAQRLHYLPGDFGDYYRLSPMLLRELHADNDYYTAFEAIGPTHSPTQYIVTLGVRCGLPSPLGTSVPSLDELNERAGYFGPGEAFNYLCAVGWHNVLMSATRRVDSARLALRARRTEI
jgi:hypothetical protein